MHDASTMSASPYDIPAEQRPSCLHAQNSVIDVLNWWFSMQTVTFGVSVVSNGDASIKTIKVHTLLNACLHQQEMMPAVLPLSSKYHFMQIESSVECCLNDSESAMSNFWCTGSRQRGCRGVGHPGKLPADRRPAWRHPQQHCPLRGLQPRGHQAHRADKDLLVVGTPLGLGR